MTDEPVRDHDLDERLRRAYATAMDQQHQRLPGRIELYVSEDVIEYLRSLCTHPSPLASRSTLWGFTIRPLPAVLRGVISVHTVQDIP